MNNINRLDTIQIGRKHIYHALHPKLSWASYMDATGKNWQFCVDTARTYMLKQIIFLNIIYLSLRMNWSYMQLQWQKNPANIAIFFSKKL